MTSLFLTLSEKCYQIAIVNPEMNLLNRLSASDLIHTGVNILASGSSITNSNLIEICQQPCIFVNGSINLSGQFYFKHPVAYVITDPRFIKHNLAILQKHYQGQCPLYLTQSVLHKLIDSDPSVIITHHKTLFLIYSVERPILEKTPSQGFLTKLLAKLQKSKRPLSKVQHHPAFVMQQHGNKAIGVSLDIRYGFVEAGTVAYVATQLAFSMGFKEINLFGVDLINANEPRFYETSQNSAPSKLEPAIYKRIVPSFDLLTNVYRQHGVMVYNKSPISKGLFHQLPFSAD